MPENKENRVENPEIIDMYTKVEALADGSQFLIPSSVTAEAGFRIPVYMTSGVKGLCEVPAGCEGLQDYDGRLWDVLTMARLRVREMIRTNNYYGEFKVSFVTSVKPPREKTETLIIAFSPAEGFTIMLPEED
jgi:hypothetical protein